MIIRAAVRTDQKQARIRSSRQRLPVNLEPLRLSLVDNHLQIDLLLGAIHCVGAQRLPGDAVRLHILNLENVVSAVGDAGLVHL